MGRGTSRAAASPLWGLAAAQKKHYYNSLALFNNRNDLKEMIGAKGY